MPIPCVRTYSHVSVWICHLLWYLRVVADGGGCPEANCEAPERAGADRRQNPCERTRSQQRYVATVAGNSVSTIASNHVNIHGHVDRR